MAETKPDPKTLPAKGSPAGSSPTSGTTVTKDTKKVDAKPTHEVTTTTTTTTVATPVPEVKTYRLKKGARHFHNGKLLNDGETIELTDNQARAFSDKFEDPNGPEGSVVNFAGRPVTRNPAPPVAPLGVHAKRPRAAEDTEDPLETDASTHPSLAGDPKAAEASQGAPLTEENKKGLETPVGQAPPVPKDPSKDEAPASDKKDDKK